MNSCRCRCRWCERETVTAFALNAYDRASEHGPAESLVYRDVLMGGR